jgi:2-polyprenyl-3-methyl-5-hydroxy-6-metoxy-1,4-benzoquinol methylase
VLDFGCGGGYLLTALPARRKPGIETNPTARREAETQDLEVYPSLDELSVEQSFTCVISSHMLEHVPNPFNALSAMRRFLSPKGASDSAITTR